MKDIKLKREFGEKEYSLSYAIRCTLDGSSYGQDAFEILEANIEKQNDFLVRLTNILFEKKLLLDDDIIELLDNDYEIISRTN